MVEHQITDTELILFLESNTENLEIYTDEYFLYFDIDAGISIVKEGEGVMKGGNGEEISLPYKFFYDKMMYIKNTIQEKWSFPSTTAATTYQSDDIEPMQQDTSDMKSTLYGKFEKIFDGLNLKENATKLLSITPVELNKKLPEPFLNEEEKQEEYQLPPIEEDLEEHGFPTTTHDSEEPKEFQKPQTITVEEEPVVVKEPVVEEPVVEEPVEEEQVEEEEEQVEEEPLAIMNNTPSSDTKLKITILLKGEPVVHIEKEKLYKHKSIYSHMKQLLKKGIRWENMDGFFIGDKVFVIGNYAKDCKKRMTQPFDQKEFENTELYKLIKENECAF